MINIKGIDHLNINVSHLEKSVSFYKEMFGFKVFEEGESSRKSPYKIIGLPGKLFLCLYENKVSKNSRLNHLGINALNFSQALTSLKEKGAKLLYGGVIEYPHSRSFYIADPDGNEIEVSEVFGGGLH